MNTKACDTCGTLVLVDEETGAEAHLDRARQNCGVEAEVTVMADLWFGTQSTPALVPAR